MAAKVGIYLVVSRGPGTADYVAEVVISESAQQAADTVAYFPGRTFREVPEDNVGRLGDYEPGFNGVRLAFTVASKGTGNGAVLASQPLKEFVDA